MDEKKTNTQNETGNYRFPSDALVRISIVGSFVILLFSALYFAKSLLFPVTLSFLLALIFSPVVRTLRRSGVPEVVTSFALVMAIGSAIIGGAFWLSDPISKWMNDIPRIGYVLQYKLASLREPVEKIKKAEEEVKKATNQDTSSDTQEVVVKEPGLLSRAASGAPNVIAGVGLAMVLLLFLLASGDMFYEKLVRVLPTLTDKKRGLTIARDVEREVSRYLLTITAINTGLGLVVGFTFFAIGMPNPVLWGILATALNFIPYAGAIAGTGFAGIMAILSFPTLGSALIAPAAYLICTVIEGQLITPALVGNRLQINSVSVFLAVAFWGWLWGFAGILIAVPMLIVLKVFALHVGGLGGLHEFLSPRNSQSIVE